MSVLDRTCIYNVITWHSLVYDNNYAALATLKQQALPTIPSPTDVDGLDGGGVQGNHSVSTTQVARP